jgi:hypothetical protein
VSLELVKKSSPSCSFFSLGAATSSPTRAGPSLASERDACVFVSGLGAGFGSEQRKGPLTLLTHYQTPTQLGRAGHKRIAAYLRNRGVKGSNSVAHKALRAGKSQSVTLPAQEVASRIVVELAKDILALKERIESIDEELEKRFFARPEARILTRGCQAWGWSSEPSSSWWPWVTSALSRVPTGSLPTLRSCPGGPRLWQTHRPEPPDARWQQGPQKGLLPVSICQPAKRPRVQGFLRTQEGRRQKAHPGSDRARSQEGQCCVGDAA